MKELYKKVDMQKLIFTSIFIMMVGFIINGCLLKATYSISKQFGDFTDMILLIIEGLIIFITIFMLFIKNPKKIICIYGTCIAVFLIYYLLFSQNRVAMISMIKPFILYNLTCFILFMEVSKDKKLFEKIVKIAKYMFVFSTIYIIILVIKNETLYDLWLAKYFLFTAIFILYDFYKNKRVSSAIITVLCIIALLATGSRSYILLFCLFAFLIIISLLLEKIKKVSLKRKILIVIITLIFVLCIIGFLMNYQKICTDLYNFFSKNGLEIRILRLLSTDNFFTSNDRINIIYPLATKVVRENWALGTGICGDRVAIFNTYKEMNKLNENNYDGFYSHNGILELYSNFGVIIATAIIIIIIYGYYKTGKNKNGNTSTIICLSFISLFPLLLTGTIWDNLFLWSLLGLLCANILNKNDEEIKEEQDKNIVMLLDNAFEPDIRVYKEAKYLIEKGYNVNIVCLDKKNEYKNKPTEIYDEIKIKRIFCRTDKTTKKIEENKIIAKLKPIIYFWWLLKFIFKAKEYLKDKDFQILHCHDLIMAFIGVVFFKDKKIIFDMHEFYGNNNNKVKNFIIKKVTLYTQNRAKWIIYVNSFQKEQCKKKNYKKLVQLPNYPKREKFNNVEKTKSDKIRISYIGKIRDFQSLCKLINNSITNNKIDISIYGNGSEFYKLLEYAKSKKIESIMKGSYDGLKGTQEIYNNTDILYSVYSTNAVDSKNWNNAMPVKSFEAIMTLTPIIASKNTVLGNFVQKNDIGFTIDDRNEEEITNLFRLLEKKPELIKEKVEKLRKIQYNYIWEEVSKNLDKIYH